MQPRPSEAPEADDHCPFCDHGSDLRIDGTAGSALGDRCRLRSDDELCTARPRISGRVEGSTCGEPEARRAVPSDVSGRPFPERLFRPENAR